MNEMNQIIMQYDKAIAQNKQLQQELQIKNHVILNLANHYEPELLTMDEIVERYGEKDAK